MRSLLLLLAAASPLPAQISSLALAGETGEIFFTTWLRPIGTDFVPWSKAYRLDEAGVSLLAQEDLELTPAWRVDGVRTSSDGAQLSINRFSSCARSEECETDSIRVTEIRSPTETRLIDGSITELSPNGRFGLLLRSEVVSSRFFGPVLSPRFYRVQLDQPQSEPEILEANLPFGGRFLADNGDVLTRTSVESMGPLQIVPIAGEPVDLGPLQGRPFRAALLPDSSAVVYQVIEPEDQRDRFVRVDAEGELRIRFVAGGEESLGVSGIVENVSADSSTLLFRRVVDEVSHYFVLDLATRSERPVTESPSELQFPQINHDGSQIIALSRGRILRIPTNGAAPETTLGPLPDFRNRNSLDGATVLLGDILDTGGRPIAFPAARGSTYRILGRRLAPETTLAPSPAGPDLGGLTATIVGAPAPLLWTSPFEVGFQAPWDTPNADPPTLTLSHHTSGWEGVIVFQAITDRAPNVVRIDNVPIAVHQTFDRLVTEADPAQPGEYIHIYATGLGPVTPPVETGHATPFAPLSTLIQPCNWQTQDGDRIRGAIVPFAGLAPNLTGYYQVVWKVPDEVQSDKISLGCDSPGDQGQYPIALKPPN